MSVRMLVVGLVVVGGVLSQAVPSRVPAERQAPQATNVCTLKVAGMFCAGCTTAVKLAAKKIGGVKDATVSYEKGRAEVTYDPAKTNPEAIAKVVTEQSGFKAEVQKKQQFVVDEFVRGPRVLISDKRSNPLSSAPLSRHFANTP